MDIKNCDKMIVVKYFDNAHDRDGNYVDYTRYKCLPYSLETQLRVLIFVHKLNKILGRDSENYVKTKVIQGSSRIDRYLKHLKCKTRQSSRISARVYLNNETLPHEEYVKQDCLHHFPGEFGQHMYGEEDTGIVL